MLNFIIFFLFMLQLSDFSWSSVINQTEFKDEIQRFQAFFGPEIKNSYRGKLEIYGSWDSDNINAYSMRDEDIFIISISGAFARAPYMTKDGLSLILCHELGHHIGGFPKKQIGHWSSSEGQADYFATAKCLRRYWKNDPNLKKRIEEASLSFIHTLAHKNNLPAFPQKETPDENIVDKTNLSYPDYQCRLDTLIHGIDCGVSEDIPFSSTDEKKGACHSMLDPDGARPSCWFKESL